MHAIHARTPSADQRHAVRTGPFPWEESHAAPEDRAVGVELQLIDLVAQRAAISAGDARASVIDREIDQLLTELGSITPALPLAG